jgi:hypothetical protein
MTIVYSYTGIYVKHENFHMPCQRNHSGVKEPALSKAGTTSPTIFFAAAEVACATADSEPSVKTKQVRKLSCGRLTRVSSFRQVKRPQTKTTLIHSSQRTNRFARYAGEFPQLDIIEIGKQYTKDRPKAVFVFLRRKPMILYDLKQPH